MGFPKGVSGNPGGRPKKVPAFVARMRELEPKALARIEAILNSDTADARDVIAAARFVYEYSRGKPRQQVELTGQDGGPIAVSGVLAAPPGMSLADWESAVSKQNAATTAAVNAAASDAVKEPGK